MTRSSTQRSAFTLVELLVAISIIAVLIAILLPSLSSARDAARKIKCGNNIRQITIATTNFTYDEKGVYPYGGYMPLGWPGGIGISWDDLTSEYYGQELTEAQMESNGIGLENPLLLCPNNPVQYIGTFAPRDYVLNAAIGRVYQGSTPAPPPFRANESDVRAPARTLLHVEAPNDSSNNGRGRVQAASIPRPLNQVAGGGRPLRRRPTSGARWAWAVHPSVPSITVSERTVVSPFSTMRTRTATWRPSTRWTPIRSRAGGPMTRIARACSSAAPGRAAAWSDRSGHGR